MNLSMLKQAVKKLEACGDHDHDYVLQSAIADFWVEVAEMEQAAPDSEYCEDVTAIPNPLMWDFGNMLWYDAFGRKARKLDYDNMAASDFLMAVRDEQLCTEVSSLVVEDVYYFIRDLWRDNEAEGLHRRDGSYCRGLTDNDYELILDILCDKLDEADGPEQYADVLQAKQHLSRLFNSK